jgi:hypothetical protein
MKLKYILASALLCMLIAPSSATSEDTPSNKIISVCRIEYTALGKSANWHLNYTYIVETNSDGSVEKVTRVGNENRPAFVREDKIIECIKTWKLSPSGKHVVVFSIGTNGNDNYISIIDPLHNSIKLVLS